MIPGASSYHSYTNFRPHMPQPLASNHAFHPNVHAVQFHANLPAQHTYGRAAAPQPVALNRYVPDAAIKTVGDNRSVGMNTQLKPGTVVEVTRSGHQTEYAYANYSGHLSPLTQSTLNHVPNEIRDQVKRMGGPSYFAHDLHNKFSTSSFMSQFNANTFHGPNKPLI